MFVVNPFYSSVQWKVVTIFRTLPHTGRVTVRRSLCSGSTASVFRTQSSWKSGSCSRSTHILSVLCNSFADQGCLSRIRVFFHSGFRIRLIEFKYFNPKKWFLSTQKYDPGVFPRITDSDPDFLPIPDPGSRGQKGTGYRIPDPDPQHCLTISIRPTWNKVRCLRLPFKGTVSRDYLLRVFFMNHLPPSPGK